MANTTERSLHYHLSAVKEGRRSFENAFQAVARMILESEIKKVVVNGKTTYDFSIFRTGKKHVIGMYDEINSFVSYVKDASEGGSSKEMAFVLVGEPGNGKTYFVDFLCTKYREFLSDEKNRKYTFKFHNIDKLRQLRQHYDDRIPDLRRPDDTGHEPLRGTGGQQGISGPSRSASRRTKSIRSMKIIGRWVPAAAIS